MNITYNASTTVHENQEMVTNFFKQADITKAYFPEVKKDISAMGQYVRIKHANPTQVFPDYIVASDGFGWTAGAGTQIRIPRKDVPVNITAIDVEYNRHGENTQITIAVTFNAKFNTGLPLAIRCIQAMVKAKLNAFKRDINTGYAEGWEPCFA